MYQEYPGKIQQMIQVIPKVKEKHKNQEKLIYALEKISTHLHTTMQRGQMEDIQKINISKTFQLDESNTLHLRNQNLDQSDAISIATMLKQVKDKNETIESISFSYNSNIGDSGITRIMQSMPANVKEIGCVACGINDD
jgi:hypothetical protein